MKLPAPTSAEKVLMDADALRRTLSRIAHEIIEANPDLARVALVGIQTRGVPLAQRLRRLIEERAGDAPALGAVDITFYRDDVQVRGGGAPRHPQPVVRSTALDFTLEGKTVVLVDDVLYTGRTFERSLEREVKKLPTLKGRLVINVFYESSTRTSSSFELAAKRLSADTMSIKAAGSSVDKGESLKDTALTLGAYDPDVIVIRHPQIGAPQLVARVTDAHVVNAGDGKHQHPTQALLDLYAIQTELGRLDGLHVAIVVAELGLSLAANGHRVVDGSGLVLAPAFVDPHVHLRTPGREDEETIASSSSRPGGRRCTDRKSTRLNSSHQII